MNKHTPRILQADETLGFDISFGSEVRDLKVFGIVTDDRRSQIGRGEFKSDVL